MLLVQIAALLALLHPIVAVIQVAVDTTAAVPAGFDQAIAPLLLWIFGGALGLSILMQYAKYKSAAIDKIPSVIKPVVFFAMALVAQWVRVHFPGVEISDDLTVTAAGGVALLTTGAGALIHALWKAIRGPKDDAV